MADHTQLFRLRRAVNVSRRRNVKVGLIRVFLASLECVVMYLSLMCITMWAEVNSGHLCVYRLHVFPSLLCEMRISHFCGLPLTGASLITHAILDRS